MLRIRHICNVDFFDQNVNKRSLTDLDTGALLLNGQPVAQGAMLLHHLADNERLVQWHYALRILTVPVFF